MGVENITKPVDSKFSRKEQPRTPEEQFASLPNLTAGSEISLRKMSGDNNNGLAPVGDFGSGRLKVDVGIGKQVVLENGTQTSAVMAMEISGDKIVVTTASGSVYELATVGKDQPDNNQEQTGDWKTSLAQTETVSDLFVWIGNHPLEKGDQRLDVGLMQQVLKEATKYADAGNQPGMEDTLRQIPSNSVREQALRVLENRMNDHGIARQWDFEHLTPEAQKLFNEAKMENGLAPTPDFPEHASMKVAKKRMDDLRKSLVDDHESRRLLDAFEATDHSLRESFMDIYEKKNEEERKQLLDAYLNEKSFEDRRKVLLRYMNEDYREKQKRNAELQKLPLTSERILEVIDYCRSELEMLKGTNNADFVEQLVKQMEEISNRAKASEGESLREALQEFRKPIQDVSDWVLNDLNDENEYLFRKKMGNMVNRLSELM